jgi:hypothetical protein
MGCMSASDAAPLPRLGEVFFDVRGNSRSMRLSWYADTGVAVLSIWQGGMCTGTFRLAIADLPRMVETLRRGPAGQARGGDATGQAFGAAPAAAATPAHAEPVDYGAPTAAYPPDPAAYRTERAAYQADPAAYQPQDPAAYQPQAADYPTGTAAYPHTGATAYAADYQTRAAGYPPEPASYPAGAAGDPTDPPGYRMSPAGYPPPPADYQPEPADYRTGRPADYQPERADYRARPAEYQPEPADYRARPAEYQPEPADYRARPAEYQPEPADYRTGGPADYQPEPAGYRTSPAEYRTDPASYRTGPAEYQPEPSGYSADEYQTGTRGYQRGSLPEQQTYSGSSAPMDYRKTAPAAHYPRDSSSSGYRDAAESTAADYQAHYGTLVTDGSPDASPGESFPYGQPAGNRRAENRHAAPEAPFD